MLLKLFLISAVAAMANGTAILNEGDYVEAVPIVMPSETVTL